MDMFKRFLIRNCVYDLFVSNLIEYRSMTYDEYISFYFDSLETKWKYIFYFAFIWVDTEQGYYFWSHLESKWLNYYKKYEYIQGVSD